MSMFSLLTVVALLIAAVAALVPRAGSRHTDGFAAVWPTAAATILAAAGLSLAIAERLDLAGAVVMVLVVAL
ncbi:hypothetical protein ACQUFH_13400, partial [Lactococcus lactis]|uniref:hypothetical protein n=1 Tax=Lactococcus lactis TaxID=1358 RepID=UPI003D13235B